ncbi:hypothetical protein MP228_012039 [Amoeboaphelidium protococcarum]|nr:hypothetical protein MP228_012039 [Amoeboaphelidium protococcarum]
MSISAESWHWWLYISRALEYNTRLHLLLQYDKTSCVELLKLYAGEPVKAIELLNANLQGVEELLPLEFLIRYKDVTFILKRECLDLNVDQIVQYKYQLASDRNEYQQKVDQYHDILQVPMKPASDYLSDYTYRMFLEDRVKYYQYRNAFVQWLKNNPYMQSYSILNVGSGSQAPLIFQFIQAIRIVGVDLLKFRFYAMERNIYAARALQRLITKYELQKVVICLPPADIRHVDQVYFIKADLQFCGFDLVISELLGSFGDNELCPECLRPAEHFLTVGFHQKFIPYKYSAYIQPITSTVLKRKIRELSAQDAEVTSCTPFVVNMKQYASIGMSAAKVWEFSHPLSEQEDFTRDSGTHVFQNQHEVPVRLDAVAGYFDCELIKDSQSVDTKISIVPESGTDGLNSWFPIIFNLEEPVIIEPSQSVCIQFKRKRDSHSMWYEWQVNVLDQISAEVKYVSKVYNLDGQHYKIELE